MRCTKCDQIIPEDALLRVEVSDAFYVLNMEKESIVKFAVRQEEHIGVI